MSTELVTRPDISRRAALIAGLALLVLPSIPALLQSAKSLAQTDPAEWLRAGFPLWAALGLGTVLAALAGRLRWMLLVMVPAAVLAPFELFYLSTYSLPSGMHVYGVIAETHAEEASSWLGPWAPWVAAGSLCLFAVVGWSGWQLWRADPRWRHRSRAWVLMAAGLFLAGWVTLEAAYPVTEADPDGPPASHPYLQHWLTDPDRGLAPQLEAVYPWGLPLRWWRFEEHRRAIAAHRQATAHHDFDVRWPAGAPGPARQVQVLVIGETGRPDRWGLYGAVRDTTPRLSARDDLLVFADAVSGASATRESVTLMLTRRPPESMLAPVVEPSFVSAFRQAGYRTYWLSNQGAAGAHETPVSVLAQEADERHFLNAVDYKGAGSFDGALLPLLAQILVRDEPRQLIVLHTLGSHLHYAHRYPRDFERFTPALQTADKPDIWNKTRFAELVNAYDNSVLYTDWLLDQAITMLAGTGAAATLLYAADHGESLFDGRCGRGGHGFAAAVNYRVPMLMWLSPAWQAERPQAMQALQARQQQPVSTLGTFATMIGLAGFEIAAPSAHGNLADLAWVPQARQVTHFGDFDRNIAGHACDSPQSVATAGLDK